MITGLLLILPIYVTYFVIKFLFTFIGGMLSPLIKQILQFYNFDFPRTTVDEFIITSLGIVFTLISLYFIGIFAANIVGRSIINYFENLLNRTPVINNIYSSVKQLVHAISLPGKKAFKRVVIIDFPRDGAKAIGFVTGDFNDVNGNHNEVDKKRIISVFVPTTPNPTSGFLIYTSEESVVETNLSVEEAFKTLLSGGVLTPRGFLFYFDTPQKVNTESNGEKNE